MTIDPRIVTIAKEELTVNQMNVWWLAQQGYSQRAIAYKLDLSRTTITDRLDAAWRTLRKHGIMVTPDGRPYLTTEVEA